MSASGKNIDTSVATMMAPLEQHALENLRRLRSANAFLRDLQSVEDKYALEFAQLPLGIPESARARLDPHSELARVCCVFEAFVAQNSSIKTHLAAELTLRVVEPADKLLEQQAKQTRRLLSEISRRLQREHDLHAQLTKQLASNSSLELEVSGEKTSSDNQSEDDTVDDADAKRVLRREDTTQLQRLCRQRAEERNAVRKLLDEMCLDEKQQLAVLHDISERVLSAYSHMVSRSKSLAATLQAEVRRLQCAVGGGVQTRRLVPEQEAGAGAEDDTVRPEECDDDSGSAWKHSLESCERHVLMVEWMDAFFSRLVQVEEAAIKRFQTVLKLHPSNSLGFELLSSSTTHAARSALITPASSSATLVSNLIHFHRLLTVSLLDPICRTLKFSAQKQTTLRKELLQSLAEATKLVQQASKKVKEQELKLASGGNSVAFESAGGKSRTEGAAPPNTKRSIADAVKANLGNFGLRSAVVTLGRATQSPVGAMTKQRTSLTDDGPADESEKTEGCQSGSRHARKPVDKQLHDARTHLLSMQRNEVEQQREIISTLRSTSRLGVRTMELMVNDFLKHLICALEALEDRITKFGVALAAPSSASDGAPSPSSKWRSLVRFPCDAEALMKNTMKIDLDRCTENPEDDALRDANQRDDEARSHQPVIQPLQMSSRSRASEFCLAYKARTARGEVAILATVTDVIAPAVNVVGSMHQTLKTCIVLVSKNQELQMLAILAASLLFATVAALVVWCHVSQLSHRWDEIAALQRSNAAAVTHIVQQMKTTTK